MIAEAAGRRARGMGRGVRSMTISVIFVTSVFCKVGEGGGGMIAEAAGQGAGLSADRRGAEAG